MTALSFDAVAAILIIPVVAAALLATLPSYRMTARLNVAASALTLLSALSLLLTDRPQPGQYLLVDDLNIVFIVLNTFVGFTTSVFSASYIAHELETGRLSAPNLRFYHAMYQIMMFGMNLAFVSNNIGLMWVAVELATLSTVVMVGIYRTHEALEAAWKYFILGSVGIALALFGTILVYMTAQPVVGEGTSAMVWTVLIERAKDFDPALLSVAFVFLLLGYGTKVGLAPLHAWLPDAHAEGPTPISAVLSGLLLNVALYALLRFKLLLSASPDALAPGPLMVAMGLTSLIFAAFMLYRRRDIKRLFAYSSIEHMGIIVFAFGMGGPLANFAGLLHMVMHSLTKSAIFFAVGHIAQVKGTQKIAEIRGLTESHPALGWGLIAGVAAIAGLPPLGILPELGAARAGSRSVAAASEIVDYILAHETDAFRLTGIGAYEGSAATPDPAETVERINGLMAKTADLYRLVRQKVGADRPLIVTAGGSVYFDLVVKALLPVLGDDPNTRLVLRSGAIFFHDHGVYERGLASLDSRAGFDVDGQVQSAGETFKPALRVWAEVLSRPEPDLAICGMGLRDVAMDQGLPRPLALYRNGSKRADLRGAQVTKLNDQHAFVELGDGSDVEIGDVIEFGISHPCTCLDRHAIVYGLDADDLVVAAYPTNFG